MNEAKTTVMWCQACRATGAYHCAHPDECGGMKTYPRPDLATERERKLVEALKLTVEDLEEWSGCKSALEAAGFNMDDTQVRAEFARATLKELGYE